MSYRIRPRLWDLLAEQERNLPWLARSAGYSAQYLRLLKAGLRPTVSATFAQRVAAVMGRAVDELFEPVERS